MILQYSTVVKIRGLLIVCVIFEKCFTTFSCFKFVVKRVRVGFRVSLDVSFTFYFTFPPAQIKWFELLYYSRSSHPLGTLSTFFNTVSLFPTVQILWKNVRLFIKTSYCFSVIAYLCRKCTVGILIFDVASTDYS